MSIPLAVGSLAVKAIPSAVGSLTVMAKTIMALYGVVSDINDFIDDQIEKMKKSDNSTISRTGRVIEGAKFGFGIGYVVPVSIIAIGQLLLGNQMAAVTTLASAAAAANPIAMTCAAVGAIYYGWSALSKREQDELLASVSKGMSIGIELIKSIIGFVLTKTKELLSAENIKEMKRFIGDAAQTFGKTLAEVTGAIKERVLGAVDAVKRTTVEAGQTVQRTSIEASNTAKRTAAGAGQVIAKTLRRGPQ